MLCCSNIGRPHARCAVSPQICKICAQPDLPLGLQLKVACRIKALFSV
jgi:hypothetical protein